MKRGWYIILWGILYLMLAAKSCDNGEEVRSRNEKIRSDQVRDSIALATRKDVPDQNSIRALEIHAIRMVYDLWDYRRIALDSTSAPEFRHQAEQMAESFLFPGIVMPVEISVHRPDSVWVIHSLVPSCDTAYSGELGIKLNDRKINTSDYILQRSVEITAVRQFRIFGSDTLLSWKVYLGKLR